MKRIILHVDKLVLKGIDHTGANAVSAGMQAELQRLLTKPDATATLTDGGNRNRIRSQNVHITHGTDARAMGVIIAGSIVRGSQS